MKRLVFAAVFALGLGSSLPAQQASSLFLAPVSLSNAAAPISGSAPHYNFDLVPALAVPTAAPSFSADPNPPSPPQFAGFRDEGYKWDLGVGYEFVHFKSAPFSSNLSGLHTDITYNISDWIGLEGNVISAWGSDVFAGERSKYVLFTGGARFGWGNSNHRWVPWAHVLVGGAHLNPQVARESKNGFALQVGGGADYRWRPRVSFRAEGDYVRTQLYSSSQNNFQFGVGAVLHF
jgi:opacity protein-like surface antigen